MRLIASFFTVVLPPDVSLIIHMLNAEPTSPAATLLG
jgi:hypothetical protein